MSFKPLRVFHIISLTLAIHLPSLAQSEHDGRPVYTPQEKNSYDNVTPFLNSAPRSLAAQRLSPSAFPDEAEIFCGYEQCVLGLTRGIVIGGDVFGMSYSPFRQYFDPNWNGGSLYIIDVFGGFQILRDVDNKSFMNAQIGYRRISYENQGNTIAEQGFTTKINYSQLITPIYLQGITFSGYFSGDASSSNSQIISQNSPNHASFSDSASYFYRVSQKYPTYHVSFPADLEVANWSSQQTGLIAPIRAYAHVEPFYYQNNLNFIYQNVTLQKQEQNFGVRFAGTASLESAQGSKTGRYSLLGSLGFDIQTSDITTTQSGNADANIPGRRWISPYVNLAASWQF